MSSFMLAGIVAVTYAIVRFLEMRFFLKEALPLKTILRDSLVVYLCVVAGVFISDQLAESIPSQSIPEVMTGDAGF